MKTNLLRTAAFTFAMATGVAGLSVAASADDSTNLVNDSMVQQRQMDYLQRHGGYMILQDQYSQSVGGRNSTMVVPAPRYVTVPAPTYVVGPTYGTTYGTTYAPASPY
ncbi:hypothetical protein GCM10007301_44260 [Azorhizobium oxalatiphilum]|uniref:Uncharacterized protein n=1 Tax=Azorhizobium oxalatiphilum TaxID=980631 RepID=A0A917CAG8_9HYPH|nr:hypothetical protein [Azorhizobium oxalatiphilum]GGF79360.1 hypothetical protein GCM10007301_44260 [Azorhizobium oxalatiphilum]